MTAKRETKELHVIRLDLPNSCVSVPHNCIKFALEVFPILEKVSDILMQYFENVFMRFTITSCTTASIGSRHHDGLGCLTSAVFIMCMELILRGTTGTTSGEETRCEGVLPPSMAFIHIVTTLVQSKVGTQELLDHFHDLFTWVKIFPLSVGPSVTSISS